MEDQVLFIHSQTRNMIVAVPISIFRKEALFHVFLLKIVYFLRTILGIVFNHLFFGFNDSFFIMKNRIELEIR